MLFNTIKYLIFIAVAVAVYYLLPHRFRNIFLLAASYVFYIFAMPEYAVLVLFTTGISYFGGRLTEKEQRKGAKKAYLWGTIGICLAFLLVFKYYNFFMTEITALFGLFGVVITPIELTWALPLGISFYTFQMIGYLADVYKGKTASEKNFIDYALFISFFPQIMSGPIGRADELLPQYKSEHKFEYGNIVAGLQRFLTGAFKKVVLADGIAKIVDGVYGKLEDYQGLTLIAAAVLYAVQLYFDFSGYTDMALGSARLLGFTLRENFRQPYLATNMGEFWVRWHISLTSWLRDYIYIPLGGNRKGFPRKLLNVLIVFLISGLWHGANETYVVWGLWLAIIRIGEELITKARGLKRTEYKTVFGRIAGTVINDIFMVIGWVFFRAASLEDAAYVFSSMFKPVSVSVFIEQVKHLVSENISTSTLYFVLFFGVLFAAAVILAVFDFKSNRLFLADKSFDNNPLALYGKKTRWLLYWIMGLSTVMFYLIANTSGGASQFIYFGY